MLDSASLPVFTGSQCKGCGLRWHIADFRSAEACRKVLGGRRVAVPGKVATASVARRRSVSLTGAELVTFLLMSDSRSCHIWRIDFVVLVSMYFRFHMAPIPRALRSFVVEFNEVSFHVICLEKAR